MAQSSPIIIHAEAFTPSYVPERMLHRDQEQATLTKNLQHRIHTLVLGPCGFGKSTLVKHVFTRVEAANSVNAVVDCAVYRTTFSVLKEVIPTSKLVFSRSNYELLKELRKYTTRGPFLVGLDNFTHLKDLDLVGRLMSLGVCVVLITDHRTGLNGLQDTVRLNIPSIIEFSAYTVEQAFEILKARTELALAKWSIPDAVLTKIVTQTKGNMTLAINALKREAITAEHHKKQVIEESDIRIPSETDSVLTRDS